MALKEQGFEAKKKTYEDLSSFNENNSLISKLNEQNYFKYDFVRFK